MILSFLKKHYLTIAIVVFGVFILYRPPVDPDFGWHYKYGEYIFKNHALLKENIFSYTFTDYKWANSYWLSELYLYLVSSKLGFVLFPLLNSLLFSIFLVWVVGKRCKSTFGRVVSLLPVLLLLSIYCLVGRPLFFSSFFLLIITYILLYKPESTKFFPLIFLVWANLHADFVLGLGIYGVYSFIDLVSSLREKRFSLVRNIAIPVFSVLATFVNPYTISLWATILKESNNLQFTNISEWLPLSSDTSASLLSFIYIYGGLVLAPIVVYRDKKTIWYTAVLILFFLLSLRSFYFYRVLIILGVFGVANFYGYIMDSLIGLKKKWLLGIHLRRISVLLLFLIVDFSAICFLNNLYLASSPKNWSVSSGYPYDAVAFIKENKLSGNMFNHYTWGGYLIWQLPEYKTFIDGRMPSWRENGEFLFKDYISITTAPEKNYFLFKKYVDEYNIGWVIDKEDSLLSKFLIKQPEWKVLWKENNAVILAKNVDNI